MNAPALPTSLVLPGMEEDFARIDFDRVNLSQWHTPDALAQRIVEWSELHRLGPDAHILEPSAGGGAFLRGLARAGQGFRGHVDAVELDPTWAARIASLPRPMLKYDVENRDYLTRAAPARRYDATIQNPPYEGGLDGLFVEKAMSESDRIVALIRTVALNGKARCERVWSRVGHGREWLMRRLAFLSERPDFGGSDGAATDFCVVQLQRAALGELFVLQPEWW